MTEKEAKRQWLKNRYAWLDRLFGPYVTEVEELSSGKLAVTITLSHLSGEEQSEIIQRHARVMQDNPERRKGVYCLVFV